MKKFPISIRYFAATGATLLAITVAGCGGGSSNGPTTPTNTPTPTPRPATNTTVTVQLRDSAGALVEGLVTLGTQRRATTGGQASFTNVVPGVVTASAEVNGQTYSQNFVATAGANTFQIAVNPAPTPSATPNSTPPAPPSFEN